MSDEMLERDGIDKILQIAAEVITGERAISYGDPENQHTDAWLAFELLHSRDMTPSEKAIIFMICLKLSREKHKHKRDNLIDIAGYVSLLDYIHERRCK